jgi:hypothetical protein
MKTRIHSIQNLPLALAHPLRRSTLPLFFALAFLPGIFHLAPHNFPVAHPMAAVGPVIAGFWLAAGLREIRVHFLVLAIVTTTLLGSVNWLMVAGGSCCATMTR